MRPSKPMEKNSNSKFTTRNNKQDIFSKINKELKSKFEVKMKTMDVSKESTDQPKQ